LDHADLIIPDVYDPDVLSTVRWLQAHLPFSDEYLAQLVGASADLFSEWKTGAQTLTDSQIQTLENLSLAINRLLSYFNFRRDLMVSVLEVHSDSPMQWSRFTPPWIGTSLKDYLLAHGVKGIAELNNWIQAIRSAS
jgi:hypothetical protein